MISRDTRSDGRGLALNRLEVMTLCASYAVGGSSAAVVPLWVAAIIKAGSLPTSQVGWLASGQSFSTALSIVAISFLGKHFAPRWVAAAAALIAVVSNAVAMFGTFQTLIVGRLLSGVATGALLAIGTRVAASRPGAQRVLALMEATNVLVVSGIYFVSPGLVDRFGPGGLFAILLCSGVLLMIGAPLGFPRIAAAAPTVAGRPEYVYQLAPIIGCLALTVVCIGQSTVGTYIVPIGNGVGVDSHTMGSVLAITYPLAILGPIAAHLLGERVGLVRPLILGLVLLATDIVCLVHAASPILLCIFTAGLNLWFLFCGTYAIALLGRLDPSGRFASVSPGIVMVGFAVGAALGGRMIGTSGLQTFALVAATCVTVGIALFAAAAGLGDRGSAVSTS